MKKLAVFLAIVITLTALPFGAINALAATYDDFVYEIISEEDKTCEITGYEGSTRNLVVPATLAGYKVVKIGDYAFQDKEFVKTVTISNGIKTLGPYAFYSCGALAEVVIPNSVTVIEEGAFMDCTSLSKVNFPDTVTFIGRNAVYNTKYIQVEITEDDFTIFKSVRGITNTGDWPNGVLYIGKHLIMVSPEKTGSVAIKDGTKTIAGDAFYWCDKITGVTIPNTVVTIGEYAFYQCKGLTSITIPNSVKNIENYAFALCYSLKNVTIPSSVVKIGDWSFSDCTTFTSITVPSSVKTIGIGAFAGCSAVKSAKINSGVQAIGSAAFYDCTALSSITIPDTVTSVGVMVLDHTAFYKASGNWTNNALHVGNCLIKVKPTASGAYTIKSGVKVVSDDAFSQATLITTVSIPNSVAYMCDGLFRECSSLRSIFVASDNSKFASSSSILYNKNLTKLISFPRAGVGTVYNIPDSVTEIGDYALYRCGNLTKVVIPNSVKKIGTYALFDCNSLENITVQQSVTEIGEWAFSGCEKLTVYGQPKSVAESFCKEAGVPFKQAQAAVLVGDANGDGFVTSIDARVVLQVAAGLKTVTADEMVIMDANGDGFVSTIDARVILQIAAGLRTA